MRNKIILILILFFSIELLIVSVSKGIPDIVFKSQKQENQIILESESTKVKQQIKELNKTSSMSHKFNSQNHDTFQPPNILKNLCSNKNDREFVTQGKQPHTFRKAAAFVRRCDSGKIWEISEDGRKVPDVATFYFDATGVLLDICQPLFWKSGCVKFGNISCEQRNYCKDE